MNRKAALWALLPLGIIAADQAVKAWAQSTLQYMDTLPLWEGVFHLTYARNTGAAFSLLQGGRWLFIVITFFMLALLGWALCKGWVRGLFGRLALLFVMGGAVGNLIDRVRFGYVIDLFDFRLINFAVFNVADAFITVGGVMMGVYLLFMDKRLLGTESKTDGNTPDGDA